MVTLEAAGHQMKVQQTFQNLLSDVTNTQQSLESHKLSKQYNKEALTQLYQHHLQDIAHMRAEINAVLDKLEENTIAELNANLKVLHADLMADALQVHQTQCTLTELYQKFLAMYDKSDAEMFIAYRQCINELEDAENLIKAEQHQYTLTLDFNTRIIEKLSELKKLGFVHRFPDQHPGLCVQGVDLAYKKYGRKEYNIRVDTDERDCHITDICQLPNGYVVLLDDDNDNLKFLNSEYEVVGHVELKYPRGVCSVKDNQVAVPVSHVDRKSDIQFITVKKCVNHDGSEKAKCTKDRMIHLRHYCGMVICRNDKLYVGDGSSVHVYDLNGEFLQTIYVYESGFTPYSFALDNEGARIYIPDHDNDRVITIDTDGNMLNTFSDENLHKTTCVCQASNGTVFVCGEEATKVIQMDAEGRQSLAITEVKMSTPVKAMWFNRHRNELVIGSSSDKITVLLMK